MEPIDRVKEFLTMRKLRVGLAESAKNREVFAAAIQRASLDLAKLAKGAIASHPSSQPTMSAARNRPDTVGVTESIT
jgi:hypothetical protein